MDKIIYLNDKNSDKIKQELDFLLNEVFRNLVICKNKGDNEE